MESELEPTLELEFYSFCQPDIFYYELPFRAKSKIEQNSVVIIPIPNDFFKYGKDKKFAYIKLFDENSNEVINRNFFVYYGKNTAYVNTYGKGSLFELIFLNYNELIISYNNKNFDKFDTFGNNNRKRLTLINCEHSININGKSTNLLYVPNENCKEDSPNLSYQISVKNSEDTVYIVKGIEDCKKINFKYLDKIQGHLDDFNSDLNNMLKCSDLKAFKEKYLNIFNKYKIINVNKVKESLFMSGPLIYIEESFKNYSNLQLFWNALLFIFIKEHKSKYTKDYALIKQFINKASVIKANIDKKKIDIFQKVCALKQLFLIFEECKSSNDLADLNFRYFLLAEKNNNSILDKVYSFFKDFIDDLKEESQVFPYLLNVDSGCGYCQKQLVYTFDMSNIQMIKEHLNNYFPKILIFYYLKYNNTFSFTDCDNGTISLNEYLLLKNYNNIKINDYNSYINDNIAFNIVLLLLHEYTGHKKFLFGENSNLSPIKFVNDCNEIIELKYIGDIVENEKYSEYILSSPYPNKGDSGNYIELCYGKYNGKLILDILNEFNNNAKLINRADLFTAHFCDVLKKYTILKSRYQSIKKQKITLSMSIEEEIETMSKVIKYEPNLNKKLLKKKTKRKQQKSQKPDESNTMNMIESNEMKKKTNIINYIEEEHMKDNKKKQKKEEREDREGETDEEEELEEEIEVKKEKNKRNKTIDKGYKDSKMEDFSELGNEEIVFRYEREMSKKYNIPLNEKIVKEIKRLLDCEKVNDENDIIKLCKILTFYKKKK